MSFYETLAPYYDEIFPVNEQAIQMMAAEFPREGRLLDIGAGTGNAALAMARLGYSVTAMEPESKMAAELAHKALQAGGRIHVAALPMQQLAALSDRYDGIYCIGNTLAHLQNIDELETFLQTAFNRLKRGGKLIIQLVNYEHVLNNPQFAFPVVQRHGFSFTRRYEIVGEKIRFTMQVDSENEQHTQTIMLSPFTKTQLVQVLEQAGYAIEHLYGSFAQTVFSSEAMGLVIIAKSQ